MAALRTERTPYLLYRADDLPFAELVDDTVSVLDGEHIAARFRELRGGGADVYDAQLEPLVAAFDGAWVPGPTTPPKR